MPSQRAAAQRRDALRDAAIAAARLAAAFIREQGLHDGLSRLAWREKQSADFVSDVDTGAEERIRDALTERFREASFVGEELSPQAATDAGLVFVVDPLDGTTNFLHGYPVYAVSIGAVDDGALEAGVILDVPRDELYTATRQGGSFLDGRRITVSSVSDPRQALLGTGFPFKHRDLFDRYEDQLGRVMRAAAGIRRAGSAALDLAAVAAGRFDAFWELRLAPWDIAAGLLLVREAGGRVTDVGGADIAPAHTPVVASNGLLHDWLLAQLESAGRP
jgi:myo-inositol-1(or 4)-monophosphatase